MGVSGEEEARWIFHFQKFVSDLSRARSGFPFDGRLTFGMVCPGFKHRIESSRSSVLLLYRLQQTMRGCRARTVHYVGLQDAPMWGKHSPGFRSLWPFAPPAWKEIEVQFRLWAGSSVSVKAYGLLLARNSFGEHLQQNQPLAWAAWCATLTLMVQSSSASLVDEYKHHESFFWLKPMLVSNISRIGYDRLIGLGPGHGIHLSSPTVSISRVKWNLVDQLGREFRSILRTDPQCIIPGMLCHALPAVAWMGSSV